MKLTTRSSEAFTKAMNEFCPDIVVLPPEEEGLRASAVLEVQPRLPRCATRGERHRRLGGQSQVPKDALDHRGLVEEGQRNVADHAPGDIVGVDCGLIRDGWHSDSAETFAIGEVDETVFEEKIIPLL